MSSHDGEGHAELLTEVLSTGGDAHAALARSPLAACPGCKELLGLGERLDGLGAAERAALSAALAGPAPARGRAEDAVRAQVLASLGSSRARASPARRWAPWLAAAAGLIALVALWPWTDATERSGSDPGGPDPKLGTELELLHPLGKVADFAPFRWSAAGPEAGWYRVVVQPLDAAGGARTPTDSGRILGTSWEPSPEVREAWGDRIRWTLEVYRATGASDLVDSRSASAELSSR